MQGRSLKDHVYEGILNDILSGLYQPNTIINEKTLVEQYQVSKTPVREALVQLCSEGVLNNIPRTGYQISMVTPNEIIETIEFRKIIEIGALEKSFHRLTRREIEELKAVNAHAETITENQNVNEHWNTNQAFHQKLCSFSGNRYLQKALEDSMKTCTRIANQYFVRVWEEHEEENGNHYKLVKALEEKDLEQAKKILAYDIEQIRDKMLDW